MTARAFISGALRALKILTIVVAVLVLTITVTIYIATPHPTRNQARLAAIKAEADSLLAAHPGDWSEIPRSQLPPTIAGLEPVRVIVQRRNVIIQM
jgi:hypothetical protein